MDPAWVTKVRDQCLDADVPFFFKQWGGTRKKKADVNSKDERGIRCRYL
jgi:protein gp37